jgi:hypothetical protein
MTYNYDRPQYDPDGKYRYHRIFFEEHNSLQDDQYLQFEARMEGRLSRSEWELCKELYDDINKHSLGWMKAADGRRIAVFGQGSPREGQPIPVKYFPRLTSKVVKRATWGRRPLYRGPTLFGRWRGFLYHIGKDKYS